MSEKPTYEKLEQRIRELEKEKSEFKRLADALEKRITALTQPLEDEGDVTFEDLFNIDDIQRIQDEFAKATGVASIITHTDGTPITSPSNFCRLCKDIIRKTDKGLANCYKSDAMIGRFHIGGPITQLCMSGGLWDAGAGITVGGKHIANWLIGQVRDEHQTEDKMLAYAREIGAGEKVVAEAFREVPAMSREQFEQIAKVLYILANQLSTSAYQNVQQARFITERRRAEEALRTSQQIIEGIIDLIPVRVFWKDRNLVYLGCNALFARDAGFADPKDVIGKNDYQMVWRDQAELYRGDDRKVIESGISKLLIEEPQTTPQGNTITLLTSKAPLRNSAGEICGVLGTYMDITERKQAEEALRDSEENMRYILKHDPNAIAVYDRRLHYIAVSDRYLQDYGVKEEDIIGKHHYEVFPEIPQKWKDVHQRCLAGAIERSDDDWFERPDGSITYNRWECRPWRRVDGEIGGIITYTEVTTERKKVEKALQEREEKYRNLFNNAEVGMFRSRLDGSEIIEVNRKFLDIVGMEMEETIGKPSVNFWADPKEREEMVKRLIADGSVSAFEFKIRNKRQGGVRNGLISLRLYREQGLLEGSIFDITDRKRAEDEKAKVEVQLFQSQKMESVGRLAGGVAHDFNNMLSIIIGFTDMAMDTVGPAHPVISNLEEIRKAANRSADLTRQLLAFARKQTIAPEMLDLNKTIEGMLKMLRRLIGEDIDLIWLPGKTLWQIKIDPSQIDQILANLCVNARDAIFGVGKMTIETGNGIFDDDYCASHPGYSPGEYVKLSVSDNGSGMDKETLDKIFEPFFTTKEQGKGTGLGLATVYGIVKQNNGFINVYSEPGQGTTFTIYLPRHTAKSKKIQKHTPALTAAQGHETILLVEDEPVILRMTAIMLERQGYAVLSANTPGEAIRMADAHTGMIHLVMTDVVMPEMNGRDLVRKLLCRRPNIKRLFMSGYTANVIAHHGVLNPDVNFIQKPFSMKDLAAKVREALINN